MGGGAVDLLSGAVSSQIGKLGSGMSAVQPFYYSTPTINTLPSKEKKNRTNYRIFYRVKLRANLEKSR